MNLKAMISQMAPFAVKDFCFNNANGGTMVPAFDSTLKFDGQALVTVVRGWHDYEIGYRFVGRAANEEFKQYLAEHSVDGEVSVYFGDRDVVNDSVLRELQRMVALSDIEDERALSERAAQYTAIQNWCNQNGFEIDDETCGVACVTGERVVFAINRSRGNPEAEPVGFNHRQRRNFGQGPDVTVLFQDTGEPIPDFLSRVSASMACVDKGVDLDGKPYDQEAILAVAQSDYRQHQERIARRAAP